MASTPKGMFAFETDTSTDRVFYVTIRRDDRYGFLAGPFNTHAEALAMVDRARHEAHEANHSDAAFSGFGTGHVSRSLIGWPKGVLNERLGIDPSTLARKEA